MPNMWKFIVVYFCGSSFTITNLQAINNNNNNVTNDVDIYNAPTLNSGTNVSQTSILDEFIVNTSHPPPPSPPPSNSTDTFAPHNSVRKIVKRNTLHIFGEKFNVQVELGPFGYSKLILFAILRVFFGIALNLTKLKQIIARPIGPAIAILCHCIFLPLVSVHTSESPPQYHLEMNLIDSPCESLRIFQISYGFGWICFADRTTKRLDIFSSGYSIGLHTFVLEPGYVIVDHKRYVVSVLFFCAIVSV